jgi:hypothetical protein
MGGKKPMIPDEYFLDTPVVRQFISRVKTALAGASG